MVARFRKLGMERMEARQMMAGDVFASVVNGNLILTEAPGQSGLDNSVHISQEAPGQIRVAGNATFGSNAKSLVNGKEFEIFNVSGSLNVDFGGGNDRVLFNSEAKPNFQDVTLNLGSPISQPGNTSDIDEVIMFGGKIRGSLTVNTGSGDDYIFIGNTDIGDEIGVDNLKVYSGSGADRVSVKDLPQLVNGGFDIQTFDSPLETDADKVSIENAFATFNIGIRMGGGDDMIVLTNAGSRQDIILDTSTGNDKVELSQVNAVDDFMADLGDGSDTLSISGVGLFVGGDTHVDAGNGTDSINTAGSYPTGIKSGFERVNGRLVVDLFGDLPMADAGGPKKR